MQRFRAVVALIITAMGLTWASAASAQSAGEAPAVYPEAGTPGTRFGFVLGGFKSRERVGVWVNYPDGRVSDAGIENLDRATKQGRVSWNWTAPAGGPVGTYQVVAQGVSSGVQKVVAVVVKDVVKPAAAGNIEPKVGRAGDLFAFYASGFLLTEDVKVWVTAPDGTTTLVELEHKSVANGRVDGSWAAPLSAQKGRWQIVVRGWDSGIEQVLPFEIR